MKTAAEIKAVFDLLDRYGYSDAEISAENGYIILDLEYDNELDTSLAIALTDAGALVNDDGFWVLRVA